MESKSIGRPTSYNDKYDVQAYKLCLLGATDKDLADFFEVVESTINKWKLDHPNFSESIINGKQIADMEVANSLYQGAIDRVIPKKQAIKIKEIQYENGKKIGETEKIEIVELEEYITADFRNVQFWLKNRKSDKWRDKQEVEQTLKVEYPLFGDED